VVRSKQWKLIHYYEDGRDELYHLDDDLGEQTNQASAHPEVASKLRKKLDEWLKETQAKIPEADERQDAKARAAYFQKVYKRFDLTHTYSDER
jgi:ElaB/YqjD/DUF883 family membrane-anchored ribosome-binding protein